jgi:hypothetical protein
MPEFNTPAWSAEKAELLYNIQLAMLEQDEDALRAYTQALEELEEEEGDG